MRQQLAGGRDEVSLAWMNQHAPPGVGFGFSRVGSYRTPLDRELDGSRVCALQARGRVTQKREQFAAV